MDAASNPVSPLGSGYHGEWQDAYTLHIIIGSVTGVDNRETAVNRLSFNVASGYDANLQQPACLLGTATMHYCVRVTSIAHVNPQVCQVRRSVLWYLALGTAADQRHLGQAGTPCAAERNSS